MIYVYDMAMKGKDITSFKRYGATYTLERRFRMGNHTFYSFICPDMEKILVVPDFAEQYREVEEKIKKFPKEGELQTYKNLISRHVARGAVDEIFPNDNSSTGLMNVLTVNYKDIVITFEYFDNVITLSKEFEIRDNNIFGNGIVVLMDVNMEV